MHSSTPGTCWVCGKMIPLGQMLCQEHNRFAQAAQATDQLVDTLIIADQRPVHELGEDLVRIVTAQSRRIAELTAEVNRLELAIEESERVRKEQELNYQRAMASWSLPEEDFDYEELERTTEAQRRAREAQGWYLAWTAGSTEGWCRPRPNGNGCH